MASNDENDTSGKRAAEDSNSSELLPGSLPVDFVEMVLILRLQTILQVENMAVVNNFGEQYLLNLELELGPCHTKIVGKNLSDVSCMQCQKQLSFLVLSGTPWFGEFYVLPFVVAAGHKHFWMGHYSHVGLNLLE